MSVGNIIAYLTADMSGGSRFVSGLLIARVGSEATAFLLQTLLSGAIGAAGCGGMSLYEIEHWSMLRIIAVHSLLIYSVFIPSAFFLGWIPSAVGLIVMVCIMEAGYFIIWAVMWLRYKVQIKELNMLQNNRLAALNSQNNKLSV